MKKPVRKEFARRPVNFPNPTPVTSSAPDTFFKRARYLWLTPQGDIEAPVVGFFRKSFRIDGPVRKATGLCFADSRYRLYVNGRMLQKGPAPFDPCFPEIDPLEIPAGLLRKGENWIACEVVFYGGAAQGDGQYLPSLPCLILETAIRTKSGRTVSVFTDDTWECRVSDAWLLTRRNAHVFIHETFDAARYDERWKVGGDADPWDRAYAYPYDPNVPIGTNRMSWTIAEIEPETGCWIVHGKTHERTIPLLREATVVPGRVDRRFDIRWRKEQDCYYRFLVPDCGTVTHERCPKGPLSLPMRLDLKKSASHCLTFVFDREVCGYPCFEIESGESCRLDLIFSEDVPGAAPALDRWRNHLRVFLKKGVTRFEALTYEAVKSMQVIITPPEKNTVVVIKSLSIRERLYPFKEPHLKTHDPDLDRLVAAAINTSRITMQDVIMDNVYRERGPYWTMGMEIGTLYALGAEDLIVRCLINFSRSFTKHGYFMCQWPGVANTLAEFVRVKGGYNLVDLPVSYVRSLWNAYYHTGNKKLLEETYPNVKAFVKWLVGHAEKKNWIRWDFDPGQCIWLEHLGKWGPLRNKECAFNMYLYDLFHTVYPAIAETVGDRELSAVTRGIAGGIKKRIHRDFWSDELGLLVNNLPWASKDGHHHIHELTLAVSILYGIVGKEHQTNTVDALANRRFRIPHVDDAYTIINAGGKNRRIPLRICHPVSSFRLDALGMAGRHDIILKDLREVWARMESVKQNLTIAESWGMRGIGGSYGKVAGAWAQCNTTPLHMLFRHIIGIRPLEPGWRKFTIEPNVGDLEKIEATCYTPQGRIEIRLHGDHVKIDHPKSMTWVHTNNPENHEKNRR